MKFSKMALATFVAMILLFVAFWYARETRKDTETPVTDVPVANSPTWVGTYRGFLPCASCEGILTTVVLKEDKTFRKHDVYLGEKDGTFDADGNFTLEEDDSKIVLADNDEKISYKLGTDVITMLNPEGEENTGELAEMYNLKRLSNDEIEFIDAPVLGILIVKEGAFSFSPFRSSKTYRLEDPKGELLFRCKEAIGDDPAPHTPIFAELKAIDKGAEGASSEYDSVLEVVETGAIVPLTRENYRD